MLQERSVTRLGENRERPIDVALICATHCDLPELIAQKLFREDLYYRVNGLCVTLPPLRERANILDLAQYHLQRRGGNGAAFELSEQSRDLLLRHPWPGNLRQLDHVIASAIAVIDQGGSSSWRLPAEFVAQSLPSSRLHPVRNHPVGPQPTSLDEAQTEIIEKTIQACGGNVSAAARALKVSRSTLYNKWRTGPVKRSTH